MLPCGTYAEEYRQDKAIVRTRLQWILLISFIVLIFIFPVFLGRQWLGWISIMSIILIAVVGLQITTGYAGQINMGQTAFWGMGSFATAALAVHFGLPFWLTIPAGGIAAAIFGGIIGLPAVRIKGFYLALVTLAAQFILTFVAVRIPGFGGAGGLKVPAANIAGFEFTTPASKYYLCVTTAVIMIFLAYGLVRSRTGRAFVAIRDNENAAEIMGINLLQYKTISFLIGTFYAGIAGGLWAYYMRYVIVDQFTLFNSIWYLGMILVGGMGSILGALLGTTLLFGIDRLVTSTAPILAQNFPWIGGQVWFGGTYLIMGLVIMLFLVFEPRGLAHRWNILKTQYRLWPFPY
jgi:branched-chain amino acid transport system permease protein